MTVTATDSVLRITDVCSVEEAETIASFLQGGISSVDLTGCTHLHTAAFQLLLAAGLPLEGDPSNPALTQWVVPLLRPPAPADTDAVNEIPQSLGKSLGPTQPSASAMHPLNATARSDDEADISG